MPSMWTINKDASCFPRHAAKSFKKDYSDEFDNVMVNLDTYIDALNSGLSPEQIKRNNQFVHNEGKGVVSITQHPLRRGAHPIRLYVYPDEVNRILYILFIGDKNQQKKDISIIHGYVKKHIKKD